MAYEPSEIMTASAMLYDDKTLNKAIESYDNLVDLMKKIKVLAKKTPQLEFGNESIRRGFLDLLDETDDKKIKDLAIGISAAKALRDYSNTPSPSLSQRIYLTGNVLPKDVQKFQVSAFCMKDYNSSDLMFTNNKKVFYGISLKKKNKPKAPEPTLINKAFDTILVGKQFDKIKKELVDIRIKYFANIVIEAVKKGIIRQGDIKNFNSLKSNNKKELFEAKNRDKKKFDRAYIDTKGYALAKGRYKDNNTNDPKSMRYFVNKKLAQKDNELYKAFVKVMNDNAKLFADSLINLILKTKLYQEMDSKDLEKFKFNFALITGIADVNKSKNTVSVFPANVLALETTLCGLTRLEKRFKNKGYKISIDEVKSANSKGAKVFLKLSRGNVNLLDLEIRYKGAFTPQPQFQATINNQYKTLLQQECGM